MSEPDETPWRTALKRNLPLWSTDMPLDVIITALEAEDLLLSFEVAEIDASNNSIERRETAIRFFLKKDEQSIKQLNDIIQRFKGFTQLDLGVTAPVRDSYFIRVCQEMKEVCKTGIPRYRHFPKLFPRDSHLEFDLHMIKRYDSDLYSGSVGTSVDDEVDGEIESDPDIEVMQTSSHLLDYLHKKDREVVIADGVAGVGKSFFSYNVLQKWADGKNLKSHRIVILIELPGKPLSAVRSLDDLLKHAYYLSDDSNSKARDAVAREIERRRGKDVLFILDGADGASDVFSDKSSYLWKIVSDESTECKYCSVLITMRPPVPLHLHRCATLRVNIKGLQDGTIDAILEIWSRNANPIHPNLREHYFFRLLCKVPLYLGAAIHCSHLGEEVGLTDLFETFTVSLVQQSKSSLQGLRLIDLPLHERDFLIRIGKSLFQLIKRNTFTFTPEDLAHGDDVDKLKDLSLVFLNPQQQSYQFAHQMFMEFLSALFLSQLPGHELHLHLTEALLDYSNGKHLRFAIVFRFFAGLTKFQSQSFLDSAFSFEEFLKPDALRAVPWLQKLENLMTILHGMHEAKNVEMLDRVVAFYSNRNNYFQEDMVALNIPVSYLYTSMDFATLAYAINNTSVPWSLRLDTCDVSQDNLGMLVFDDAKGLRELKLDTVTITDFGVDCLYNFLTCYQSSLQSFSLIKLRGRFPLKLFAHLEKCQIQVLELRDCKLLPEPARALSQCVLASLEKLILSDNPELAELLPELVPTLRHCPNLWYLQISHCSFGPGSRATTALVDYVKTSSLRTLWFEDETLAVSDVSSLLDAVAESSLTKLRLHEFFYSHFRKRQNVGKCQVGFGLGLKQLKSEDVDHHDGGQGWVYQAFRRYLWH